MAGSSPAMTALCGQRLRPTDTAPEAIMTGGRPGPRFRGGDGRKLRGLGLGDGGGDDEAAIVGADLDGGAVGNAPFENLLGPRGLQFALDDPLQRPRAVDR